MVLNIVTDHPQWVLEDLQRILLQGWNVEYYRNVADGIHEYKLTPIKNGACLSVEQLLETGVQSWNIRICEYESSDKQ